mmetsp:Transcript_4030/g.12020  ORF Transcript_4030/g.12020 Transcript_4030/m.12020 type:complete len:82 (+) Transcript_4030:265-510(+)
MAALFSPALYSIRERRQMLARSRFGEDAERAPARECSDWLGDAGAAPWLRPLSPAELARLGGLLGGVRPRAQGPWPPGREK